MNNYLRAWGGRYLPAAAGALLLLCVAKSYAAPNINDFIANKINSLQESIQIVQADRSILGKMGRDFEMAYRFKRMTLSYMAPNRLRLEGEIGITKAIYIINGEKRYFAIPKLGLKQKSKVGATPGTRQSLLDAGLLTPDALIYLNADYLRTESCDGKSMPVFQLTYKGANGDESKYIVWFDPQTHITARREWVGESGRTKAIFLYTDPVEAAPGIWLPTKVEVEDGGGQVAAITTASRIKVNTDLSASLFDF
ncbi:MAG: hypothetical protein M1330_03255 [Armatimonadetes bacterium]|nr:hypothetical protein [Armatimonadota bacterium]